MKKLKSITLRITGDQERIAFQCLHLRKESLEVKLKEKSAAHQSMIRYEIKLINQLLIQLMGSEAQYDPMLL
ncbi:hypothetical protein [Seinonella peptonophila]|uniref:hypothetical protein n=1 Tax=Seinonella peptonophila TaxID=112248 RepID=UPI0009334C0D|nr:hypothetical protein [Seinonella peptonophila]